MKVRADFHKSCALFCVFRLGGACCTRAARRLHAAAHAPAVLQRSGRASNRRRQTKHIQKLLQNGTQSVQATSECKNIEKLLQIRMCQKSKPVFSFRKFTKSSHPSGGVTPPEGLHTFRGADFFGHMSKKCWSQATTFADFGIGHFSWQR